MIAVATLELALLLVAVIILAGTINGLAGFGFAIVGTTTLATVVDPATAVIFMIVPILFVNLSLVTELSRDDIRHCGQRFTPLLVTATLGALLGMVVLDAVPAEPLRVLLGLVALGFVATSQHIVSIPTLSQTRDRCFVETPLAMSGIGLIGGFLFGATNVGVHLVAYVRSFDLSHAVFVGVVAMVFVGLNGIRVLVAFALGLYGDPTVALSSVGAVLPAIVGVEVGRRVRHRVTERYRRWFVLGLLTIIGLRLVLGGLHIV